jgi:hypothetical protein
MPLSGAAGWHPAAFLPLSAELNVLPNGMWSRHSTTAPPASVTVRTLPSMSANRYVVPVAAGSPVEYSAASLPSAS